MTRRGNDFSRRRFLGSMGAGALALSCLRRQTALAQNASFPKRLVVFFTPNGTIPSAWGADGTRDDFTLRPILSPLEAYKSRLNVIAGLDASSCYSGPGDDHQTGMGHWLTGVELLPGDIMGGCETCLPASFPSGISMDQAVANHIGTSTRFGSLELGVLVSGGENTWNRMSSGGSGQPLPPDDDPSHVFDYVFGDLGSDPLGHAERRSLQKSVLDFVRADFSQVRKQLGRESELLLDRHESVLRDIEQRLDAPTQVGLTCQKPERGEVLDPQANDNAPAIGRLQMDMLAMALACDLTRVCSVMWTNSVGQLMYPWAGVPDRHHDLSHEGDGNLDAQNKLISINTWLSEQFAYLLSVLDAVPEGDGTMLDNTLVLWGNELAVGNSHSHRGVPFVLAGGSSLGVPNGQFLQYDGRPHNDLLTSICRAFGMPIDQFGDPRFNTGVLSELT